ncbi:MAG: hypothetical protein K2O21_01045 [Malacoplasma sp.]|nr:hypothetical protein [Malacoplasma sp.]MDE7075207.1 hypothetical protein [Malacoplasma sp.]MDE7088012.1 hypothetical protein [Malacoplasma sp.]
MVKKFNKKRLSFLLLVPSILVPITLVSCGNSNETSQSSNETSDIVDNSNNQYYVTETQNGSVLMFSGISNENNKTVEDFKNEIWSSADWNQQSMDSITTYTALNFREVSNFQTFVTTYINLFKNTNTTTGSSVDLNLSDVNSNAISSDLVIGTVSIVDSKSEQFSSLSVGFIFTLKEGVVWKNSQKNYIISFTIMFMNTSMNTAS